MTKGIHSNKIAHPVGTYLPLSELFASSLTFRKHGRTSVLSHSFFLSTAWVGSINISDSVSLRGKSQVESSSVCFCSPFADHRDRLYFGVPEKPQQTSVMCCKGRLQFALQQAERSRSCRLALCALQKR